MGVARFRQTPWRDSASLVPILKFPFLSSRSYCQFQRIVENVENSKKFRNSKQHGKGNKVVAFAPAP